MTSASTPKGTQLTNGVAVPLAEVALVSGQELAAHLALEAQAGATLAALCALPAGEGAHDLLALMLHDEDGQLALTRTRLGPGESYPAITPLLPAAHVFERLLFEEHGITPEGHPWLKPVRRHRALERATPIAGRRPAAEHPFFRLEGAGVHEVAVGPVHAGVIEPGHFRFQCTGEVVHHLEIHLGYQHRGLEGALPGASPARRQVLAESIAGDTVIGHGLACCMLEEALAGVEVPLAAQELRGIALELERAANHVGDMGALCNDVGYLPGASWFGGLRGELLNLLIEISGSRFGRGLLVPGGVRGQVSAEQRQRFQRQLGTIGRKLTATAALAFDSPSVLSRFERTGVVSRQTAEELGLSGPIARASGVDSDVRRDHPHGIYRFALVPVATAESGDVMGRALVRWLEVERSLTFIAEQLRSLPEGPRTTALPPRRPGLVAAALVEGWRGRIVHLAVSDEQGGLRRHAVVDPSLQGWFGLAMALRGNQISDFPLCNKSFNLSYAGHDL